MFKEFNLSGNELRAPGTPRENVRAREGNIVVSECGPARGSLIERTRTLPLVLVLSIKRCRGVLCIVLRHHHLACIALIATSFGAHGAARNCGRASLGGRVHFGAVGVDRVCWRACVARWTALDVGVGGWRED